MTRRWKFTMLLLFGLLVAIVGSLYLAVPPRVNLLSMAELEELKLQQFWRPMKVEPKDDAYPELKAHLDRYTPDREITHGYRPSSYNPAHEAMFAGIAEALEKKYCCVPPDDREDFSSILGEVVMDRLDRFTSRLQRGREEEALVECLFCLRLYNRSYEWGIQIYLLDQVFGILYDALIEKAPLSTAGMRAILRELPTRKQTLAQVNGAVSDLYQRAYREASKPDPLYRHRFDDGMGIVREGRYDQRETIDLLNKLTLQTASNMRLAASKWDPRNSKAIEAMSNEFNNYAQTYGKRANSKWDSFWLNYKKHRISNIQGKAFLTWYLPPTPIQQSWAEERVGYEALRLILAHEIYSREKRVLPRGFDDLMAAKLLDERPLDWYSGKPLIYLPQERVVRSVGGNLRDDGSTTAEGWPSAYNDPDLVWRLPR